MHDAPNVNEFEQYMGTSANPIQGQRWAQSAIRPLPGRSPLGGLPQPHVQMNVASGTEGQVGSSHDGAVDTKLAATTPATAHVNSPVDSAAACEHVE